MKKLLFILFVCLPPFLGEAQTTYYISNEGSTGNNGTSTSTTWPLSKVNSTTFFPGDQILFKRGETFVGSITVSQSGNSGNPITYGAYGSGANPVFNGLTSVTSWTNLGGNIWESSGAVSTLPTLKLVLINGVNTPMGSTPNRDAFYPFLPNYFTIDSHTGTGNGATTITSSSLTTNWAGADVVVRVNHWTLDKEPITSQSGTTLSFTGQTTSDPITDGWGFWIQNDPRTLDVQNEWYYNPSTKKIRIYSTSAPTNVQVTTVDTMFYAHVQDYITIDHIDFKGTNTSPIVFSACNHPTVTNCTIQYSGETALEAQNTSNNLTVDNCTFADIGGAGIWNTDGGSNWTLTNNTFKRMDLVSVIKNNDYTNAPIEIFAPNSLVQYNSVDSTAYEGIHFRGNNVQIRNNLVNHTSMLRDDGGGIYTGFTGETGKIIDGNIVLNSIGNARGVGTADAAGNGIYMDGLADGITVTNNTVAFIKSAGIFLNNDTAMSVHDNTVLDAGGADFTKGALMIQTYNGAPYASYQRNMNVTNNIFFQKRANQVDVFYYTASDGTNTLADFGVLDSNWYAKATDTTYSIIATSSGSNYQNLTFTGWQTFSGKEAHGHYLNQLVDTNNIKFVYNASKADSVVALGANYKDVKGATYNGTITLQPYSSAILIYNSPLTSPPSISISADQTITVDSTGVSAVGTAASGETITGYAWTVTSGTGTFGSPTSASTTVTGLSSGANVLRCTVTQTDGQTAYKEVTITVNFPAPTANAGTDQTITLPASSANLSGSGTVASGQTPSYLWTKVSGSGTQIITGNTTLTPTVSGMTVAGDYVFQLKVTQTDNQFATSTVTVHVNPAVTPQQPYVLFPVPIKVIQLH